MKRVQGKLMANCIHDIYGELAETDFNPDIIPFGLEDCYHEGLRKGFAIGFGIPVACLGLFTAIYEFVKRKNKKEEDE